MKKIIIYVLIILLCVTIIIVIKPQKRCVIQTNTTEVEFVGEQKLTLLNDYENVRIPHINIKGNVEKISKNEIIVNLSEYAETFLETNTLTLKNENFKLDVDDKVFVMLKDIEIKGNELDFESGELYLLMDNYNPKADKKDYIVCLDDYGGILKIEGNSFDYEGSSYFISDVDLSENNEFFYKNIKSGTLLVEEYKSIVVPFKLYRMINPQETRFEDIVQIYKNRRKGEKVNE